MKKFLVFLLMLISFTAAMRMWQIKIAGLRILIFNLLSVIFIIFFIIENIGRNKYRINIKKLRQFIYFLVLWFLIISFSIIPIILFPIGASSFSQFFKGYFSEFVFLIFSICIIKFLPTLNFEQREKIVNYYILGVLLSCFYEFAQIIAFKIFQKDIDTYIWNTISFNVPNVRDFFKYEWEFLYRGTGFTGGPDAQATYIVTALPFLFLKSIQKNKKIYLFYILIAIIGLFLTMSRTGFVALAITSIVLILRNNKLFKKIFLTSFVVGIILLLIFYLYRYELLILIQSRSRIDYSRIEIYKSSLSIFYNYPFGIGFNNYSLALPHFFPNLHDFNAHNSWLNYLVETGIVGLLIRVFFYLFILYSIRFVKTINSEVLISVLIGLSIASLFNNVLDLFYVNYFILLFFTIIILEKNNKIKPTLNNL